MHIIMEYAPHGELFTKLTTFGKLPEKEAKSNLSQIVSAVSHMVSAERVYHNCPNVAKPDFIRNLV